MTARELAQPDKEYRMAGVKWYAEGVFHRETVLGKEMSAKFVTPLVPGALIYNRLFAWKESFAVVGSEHAGLCVSSEFPQFMPDTSRVLPEFLYLFCTRPKTIEMVNAASAGSAAVSRNRFKEEEFLKMVMPLPTLPVQKAIVAYWQTVCAQAETAESNAQHGQEDARAGFLRELGFSTAASVQMPKVFSVNWENIANWSGQATFKRLTVGDVHAGRFPVMRGRDCLADVSHGCSVSPSPVPTGLDVLKISAVTRGELRLDERKYAPNREAFRTQFSLKAGDVLLCRTNGTLGYVGMSALVTEDHPDLIFPDKVIRVRPQPSLLPEFLWLLLQTPPLRAQIEAAARTAVGNYAIGGTDIWNFEFPVPPHEVQRQLSSGLVAARAEAARLQAEARRLREQAKADVQAMILGSKPVHMEGG